MNTKTAQVLRSSSHDVCKHWLPPSNQFICIWWAKLSCEQSTWVILVVASSAQPGRGQHVCALLFYWWLFKSKCFIVDGIYCIYVDVHIHLLFRWYVTTSVYHASHDHIIHMSYKTTKREKRRVCLYPLWTYNYRVDENYGVIAMIFLLIYCRTSGEGYIAVTWENLRMPLGL